MLFVGDDWAQDHHDVEVQDESGRRLAKARLPEGVAGVARFHAMLGEHVDPEADFAHVVVGIETDRGPWVYALVAAGYRVFAVNPLQASRFRQRHSVSGAKSDSADAHTLADMVRTDSHQLRAVAGDSELAEAIKVVARAHKTLIWERTRHVQRLRQALGDFFPAALEAFDDVTAPDALELLGKAADPESAARLTRAQITAALRRARRRHVAERAEQIRTALRTEQLTQPPTVTAAYAATVRSQVAVLAVLNAEMGMEARGESSSVSGHRASRSDTIPATGGVGAAPIPPSSRPCHSRLHVLVVVRVVARERPIPECKVVTHASSLPRRPPTPCRLARRCRCPVALTCR